MPQVGKWLIEKVLIALINVFLLITSHFHRLQLTVDFSNMEEEA